MSSVVKMTISDTEEGR